jgi:hypothetical protein
MPKQMTPLLKLKYSFPNEQVEMLKKLAALVVGACDVRQTQAADE